MSGITGRLGNVLRGERGMESRVPIYTAWTNLPAGALDGSLAAVRVGSILSTMVYDSAQGKWVGLGGMTKIADGVLSGGKFDFTNIPAVFTHLRLTGMFRIDQAQYLSALGCTANGDTGTNYRYHYIRGTNATYDSAPAISTGNLYLGQVAGTSATTGIGSPIDIIIPNYADTAVFKASMGSSGDGAENTNSQTALMLSHWLSSAAINRLTVQGYGAVYNIIAPSKCALYGIN